MLLELRLDCLKIDHEVQARAATSQEVIDEYAAAMSDGAEFPAPVVFRDGDNYWLAAGFHRVPAALQIGRLSLACDVRQGDKRAATLFAVGDNHSHGLQRTREDKRRAVEMLLADPEWRQWNNAAIAKAAKVHPSLVGLILRERNEGVGPAGFRPKLVERNGKVEVKNTARIGSDYLGLQEGKRRDFNLVILSKTEKRLIQAEKQSHKFKKVDIEPFLRACSKCLDQLELIRKELQEASETASDCATA